VFSNIYAMLGFVNAQTRVNTATGGWLDLCAADYFGHGGLPRLQYEQDSAYRTRILYNLTAPRGTYAGMAKMLTELTGNAPLIVRPNSPVDCGGYGTPSNPAAGGGLNAYSSAGCYGNLQLPNQVFITVYPSTTGYGTYGGYGYGTPLTPAAGGGYGYATEGLPAIGGGAPAWVDPSSLPAYITDSFIYEQVNEWMPAGNIAWTKIA
jgi:hypothetical protein